MIRRIKLVNFMSHSNTVIEPADGLTILIGQNNCGKSAIVSALQILSGNATGDFMVRHGEHECIVTVETDEGHVIEWRRKGGTVSYRLNGRDVHRLQRSVPDELHDLLRLPCVQSEGGDFDIHFAEQKNPIFLLNETSSRRATFFASSSDAIKLIEMQNVHRRKIQDAKGRESDFVKREGKLKARLEALCSLDQVGIRLTDLEACHSEVVNRVQAIRELHKLRHDAANATYTSKKWTAQTSALSKLTPPPAVADTKQLVDLIYGAARTAADVSCGRELCAVLRPLTTPPAVCDTAPISDVIASLDSTQLTINLSIELQGLCRSLIVPPELPSTLALCGMIQEIQITDGAVQSLRSQKTSLATVLSPPVAVDTERLREMIGMQTAAAQLVAIQRAIKESLADVLEPPAYADMNGLLNTIDQIVESEKQVIENELMVQQLRENLAESEHDLRHLAEQLNTCPICGQDFDADRLVAASVLRVGERP